MVAAALRGASRASLGILDDVTTSPASRRLVSARPALAPKCQLILARTLSRSLLHSSILVLQPGFGTFGLQDLETRSGHANLVVSCLQTRDAMVAIFAGNDRALNIAPFEYSSSPFPGGTRIAPAGVEISRNYPTLSSSN